MEKTFLITVCVVALVFLDATTRAANQPAQLTKDFITNHPGWKAMYQGERLVALYGGPGIANQTTSDKAAFVESFAQGERPAFGIADSQLALENAIPLGNGDKTVYTYRQEIDGVPVHGSRITVIAQGADGGTISYTPRGLK